MGLEAEKRVKEAEEHLAAGRVEDAIAACREALAIQPDCLGAHVCMAHAKLPGDDFLAHLARFHETLRPRVYLEIGVDVGRTLSLARPPTRAIGVDPGAKGGRVFAATTMLFALESNVFFQTGEAARALAGEPVDLAFVDGLHLFEQALRDFQNIERYAGPGTVAVFHDCLPHHGRDGDPRPGDVVLDRRRLEDRADPPPAASRSHDLPGADVSHGAARRHRPGSALARARGAHGRPDRGVDAERVERSAVRAAVPARSERLGSRARATAAARPPSEPPTRGRPTSVGNADRRSAVTTRTRRAGPDFAATSSERTPARRTSRGCRSAPW